MQRITLRALVAALVALTLFAPSSASAADIYKYWSYFTVKDGAFVYADKGPGQTNPADGSIEAYRYAAPADFNNPNYPRADLAELTFDAVCGDTTAAAGEKRVAVLVDYGVEQDAIDGQATPAPEAGCAVVPADATGIQVLQSVVSDVRVETTSSGAAVCGIDGYPATGCFDNMAEVGTPADGEPVEFTVAGAEDEPADGSAVEDEDSNNTLLLVGVGVVVILILGAAVARQRAGRTRS